MLTYYYDATGICGFRYKDLILGAYTDYQYRKNLQGDIIGIYGSGRTLEVTYRYDAWGNLLSAEGNTLLIDVNPFTYRGYYRDAETGWYYLNSRYYDPSVCRFINADDSAYLEPETLCGMNLYSYCNNNPVMFYDPSGHSVIVTSIIIGLIIGAVAGGIIGGIVSYQAASAKGVSGWELAGETALGVLGGIILGGIIGAGIGALAGTAITAASTALSTFLSSFSQCFAAGSYIAVSGQAAVMAVNGAQIAGAIVIGSVVFFAVERMGPGRHSNNQAENKLIDYFQKKYGFDRDFRKRLHRKITGKGFDKKIIEEIIKQILGLD